MASQAHIMNCARFAAGEGPRHYGVTARGTCMEPLYMDGDTLIVDSVVKYKEGDVVIVHIKPEFVKEGQPEAYVKRLRMDFGLTFPWDPKGSDVILPLVLETLNPPQRVQIPSCHIAAVHKVVGRAESVKGNQAVVAKRTLEAA